MVGKGEKKQDCNGCLRLHAENAVLLDMLNNVATMAMRAVDFSPSAQTKVRGVLAVIVKQTAADRLERTAVPVPDADLAMPFMRVSRKRRTRSSLKRYRVRRRAKA